MLPFLFLFLVVSLGSLFLDRHYMSRLMDERISRQTERISEVLSNWEFILNPVYVNKLGDVLEGDIIIFQKPDRILVSTLSQEAVRNLLSGIRLSQVFTPLWEEREESIHQVLDTHEYPSLLVARKLFLSHASQREMVLCLISSLSDVTEIKSGMTRYMTLMTLCGLALVGFVGYIISRSVTRPVKELVKVTEDIADGNFQKKTHLPSVEELYRLASSINTMTDKLKEYEQQIVRSSQLATAGKITAAMAHEIRNPLSSIKMMTQVLKARLSDKPEENHITQSLFQEIIRLERIVRDLTDLAKPSELFFSSYDMNEVLKEVFPIIEPKMLHRKIHLIKELQNPLPLVKTDKDRIKQVIWNLLLNAMESMPAGGAIKISSRVEEAPQRIEVIIEDEGHGIDEETLQKVFTPFFTTKPEGLGLGLSTSKEIVERHGGRLTVQKRGGKGVRTIVSLPIIP